MPKVVLPILSVNETVSRMVISDLTEQVKQLVGLKNVDDTRIQNYNGNIRGFQTAIGENQTRFASFGGQTRLFVEAEEEYQQEGWASSVVGRYEHTPLFDDIDTGVAIIPTYTPCNLTLKFKFQTSSQDEAQRWHNEITVYLNMLREGSQHKLKYHINLQNKVWMLLHRINELRENVKGYGYSFQEYVQKYSHNRLTLISAADGEGATFSYGRILNGVNGYFDVSPFPEKPIYEEGNGIWECTLNYKIVYDRPTNVTLVYPLQVHQQYLDDKYIVPIDPTTSANDRLRELSQSQRDFSMFESYNLNGRTVYQDRCIRIPSFDDYVFRIKPSSTAEFLVGLLSLEDKEKQVLLNLGELGDAELDVDLLQFLRDGEYAYLNKPFESFFMLNLYRNDDLINPGCFYCDENLNVWNTDKEQIDLRKSYRIRLSLVVDPNLLPYSAFQRVASNPNLVTKLVIALNDALRHNSALLDRLQLKPLRPWEFEKLWWILKGTAPGGVPNGRDPGNHFKIPPEEYSRITRNFGMRTVQFQGTFVSRS